MAQLPRTRSAGDFNSPRREDPDGTVLTWAQHPSGELRPLHGERWDSAERNVLVNLKSAGLADVFRELNGYAPQDGSWAPSRRPDRARRFDHILAPPSLNPTRCEYVHAWRTERPRLSDHSAIEAVFEPR